MSTIRKIKKNLNPLLRNNELRYVGLDINGAVTKRFKRPKWRIKHAELVREVQKSDRKTILSGLRSVLRSIGGNITKKIRKD